jgi:outer membrane immunogenic protein
MKKLFAALSIILGSTIAAAAADMAPAYTKAPVMPATVASWGGFYVGINGGGAWGRTDTSLVTTNGTVPFGFFDVDNIAGVNAAGNNRIHTSGGIAGGQIGYIWQNGGAIFGIEAAFDWTNLNGSQSRTQAYFDNPNLFTVSQNPRADWLFTFLGRVGYDLGAWYPYVTGGLALSNLQYGFNYTDNFFAPGCACAANFSQTKLGGAVGAGLAWRITGNWTLRGEYLYIAFGDLNGTSTLVGGPIDLGTASFAHTAKFSENIARLSLDYTFGGGPVLAKY